MKQLYEEMYKLYNWCFSCPHTDMHLEISETKEKQERPTFGMRAIDLFSGPLGIKTEADEDKEHEQVDIEELHTKVSKALIESIGETTCIIETSGDEKDEWEQWESSYELALTEFHTPRCPFVRKKGLELNIDREFVIPDNETEVLHLLDKMSQCYPQECRYNKREHWGVRTVTGMMRVAIAKIDFALIERGLDFGKLMRDMYFPYYDRKNDIHECGYSWDLIRYYLNKYDIKLLSNDEYDAMDTSSERPDFKNTVEYKDALSAGQCDENGKLLVKKAEFTRFAVSHFEIKSSYKQYWTRFDQIFTDENGKTISYRTFLQSCRDQGLL